MSSPGNCETNTAGLENTGEKIEELDPILILEFKRDKARKYKHPSNFGDTTSNQVGSALSSDPRVWIGLA